MPVAKEAKVTAKQPVEKDKSMTTVPAVPEKQSEEQNREMDPETRKRARDMDYDQPIYDSGDMNKK